MAVRERCEVIDDEDEDEQLPFEFPSWGKAPVWKLFQVSHSVAKANCAPSAAFETRCLLCAAMKAKRGCIVRECGGTSNLCKHLAREHSLVVSSSCALDQPRISDSFGGLSSVEFERLVCDIFAEQLYPFSHADARSWGQLASRLRVSMPGRHKLKTLIAGKAAEYRETTAAMLHEAGLFHVCIDGWKGENKQKVICAIAVFGLKGIVVARPLGLLPMQSNSASAANIAEAVSQLLLGYQLSQRNVVSVQSDGEAAERRAVELLCEEETEPCFVHTGNLCVRDVYEHVACFRTLLDKISELANHFAHSPTHDALLLTLQEGRGTETGEAQEQRAVRRGTGRRLVSYCQTRFHSAAESFERAVALHEACHAALSGTQFDDLLLLTKDVEHASDFATMLRAFGTVLELVGGDAYETAPLAMWAIADGFPNLFHCFAPRTTEGTVAVQRLKFLSTPRHC